ncbi:MAG: fimbrillin family protein, partial [Bacteroidales bacterium]|nr:fimbrillin family protein [Bacteroidales bacterium]
LLAPLHLSCIKERCCGCDSNPVNDTSSLLISFSSDYKRAPVTKNSSSVFPAGIMTSIFTFSSGENPAVYPSFPGTPLIAVSDVFGNLSINSSKYLFVPAGVYDFYSVSANSSSLMGIEIEKGLSGPLANGIDYLWSSGREIKVNTNTNVCLIFSHSAVKVVVTFVEGDGVRDLLLKRVSINPPEEGARMVLSTGEISPAGGVDTFSSPMKINSRSAQEIILPLKRGISIPFEVEIKATLSGKRVDSQIYRGYIPSPQNGFASGNAYHFTARVSNTSITFFGTVTVEWEDKSITNIDINE